MSGGQICQIRKRKSTPLKELVALGMETLFIITSLLGVAAMNTGLNLSLLSRYSYGHKGIIFPMGIMALLALVGIIFIDRAGGVSEFMDKASGLGGLDLGNGITAVVGSWIAGAVMGVDMFRFNKNTKAVLLCAASCFIFTNPILNFVGYIGVVEHGDYN